jgi:hypothetical protein
LLSIECHLTSLQPSAALLLPQLGKLEIIRLPIEDGFEVIGAVTTRCATLSPSIGRLGSRRKKTEVVALDGANGTPDKGAATAIGHRLKQQGGLIWQPRYIRCL